MSEMIREMNGERAVTLETYETRIRMYREQTIYGYIGIGRTLIEAKESKVVPHRQWAEWATRQTGLSIKQVQRLMQVAREVQEGSQLARLEFSKAQLLLSSGLDDEGREELARAAADTDSTYRELKRSIEEYKRREQELTGQVDEAKRELREADKRALMRDAERGRAEERLRQSEEQKENLLREREGLYDRISELESGEGLNDRARMEIARLQTELKLSQEREEKSAEELSKTKRELNMKRLNEARGVRADALGVFDLTRAVQTFIGTAGVLAQMGGTLARLNEEDRETIRQNIDLVADWVSGAYQALESIQAEGAVL